MMMLWLSLVEVNFRRMREAFRAFDVDGVDSVVLDFGVSLMYFDCVECGFLFMNDGLLDMCMGESVMMMVEEIVNAWSEEEIGRILREYGEEKYW